MLLFALLLIFQASWLFLLAPHARARWPWVPTLFITTYIFGLLPFSGTGYNMRYFLPAFAFIAPVLANGAKSMVPSVRTVLFGIYGILAAVLILTFNVSSVGESLKPLTSRLYNWQPGLGDWLDNLRLPVQMELKKQIETINAVIPHGGTLYWSSDYYGVTTHGLAHHLGVRDDINIRYVLQPADVPESSNPIFLTLFTSFVPPEEYWPSPEWATVRTLGYGLFRLDPVSIHLQSISGDFVSRNEPTRLRLQIAPKDGIRMRDLEIADGKMTLRVRPTTLPDVVLSNSSYGRHEYIARATYGESEVANSLPVVVYVGVSALERRATSAGDLMDEFGDGSPIIPKDTLSLDEGERAIGIRFEDIRVPRDAHIADAFLMLTAASPAVGTTTLQLRAELAGNSTPLYPTIAPVSARSRTRASVTWHLDEWPSIGSQKHSPNLAPLLEEIFAQAEWQPGNSVLLIVRATGQLRLLKAAPPAGAPLLYIQIH